MWFKFEKVSKDNVLCVTGHRPSKLPWRYNEEDIACLQFEKDLKEILEGYIKKGYKVFLTGMAIGVDTIFAETIIKLKKTYKSIKLVAVIPCLNQQEKWSESQKLRYKGILKKCNLKIIISKNYTQTCMNDRNKFMIEHSSLCVAVWNGTPSGTGNTILYAKENGCEVCLININKYEKI